MLVFVGTGAVVFGNGLEGLGHLGIAFAFGLAIVVAAYSIGTVSGAHLNPAVSIAMFVNKRLSSSELVNYILGQVVGAFLASAAVFFLLANSGMSTASLGENALANGVTVLGGFLFEVIATFLFVLVIMTVTSASKGNGAIAGLVIGLSLMAMILVGLNITGLSVNPAVSIAMFVNKRLPSSELVNYILGQVVGAFLASASVFFLLANSGMSTASLGENALASGVTVFGGFLFEVIATFLFVLVIMTVTSASKGNGAIAGLVIGLSLMAMILVGLNITGLSVNPARSLAPAVLVGGAALQQV